MRTCRTALGFTLIEMLTVIAIIALVVAIAFPSISAVVKSAESPQAMNLVDSQLSAARGIAVRDRQYTVVHFQKSWKDNTYWLAIFQYSEADKKFHFVAGTEPVRMPRNQVLGEVSKEFLTPDRKSFDGSLIGTARQREGFTTLNVLFDPSGRAVTDVLGGRIEFYTASGDAIFDDAKAKIWHISPANKDNTGANGKFDLGVLAVCIFDVRMLDAQADRGTYLNENARFLPIAPYTGGVLKTPME